MSDCRLFVDSPLQVGRDLVFNQDQGHYLRQVMRLAVGDSVTLFNGESGEYEATISQLSKQHSACHVLDFHPVTRELPIPVHIIQAAARSDRIETALQKGTELGAASFQICSSERTTLKLGDAKLARRLDRWRAIIIEAAEQSGRTCVPDVFWRPSLRDVQTHGHSFCLHTTAEKGWPEVRSEITGASAITFAIGPEGGWSNRDIEMLETLGITTLKFGPRIMRTETAAPALLAAVQACID